MSVQAEDVEWTDEFGVPLSNSEFVLKHISNRVWEQLGLYPQLEDRTDDGICMKDIELDAGKVYDVKIVVNHSDSTFNVEAFTNEGSDHTLWYGRYLVPVDHINSELLFMQELLTR